MKFSQHVAQQQQKPSKTLELEPSAFAPTWEKAPRSKICIGLRGVSDGDESTARAEAEKLAREDYKHEDQDNYIDCFNDLLMRNIVARGICDPNDVTKPHPTFKNAETRVRYLTPASVRYLYEELERLQLETSPLHPEATDDEIAKLVDALFGGQALTKLPEPQARRVRKLLRYVLEELDPDSETATTH
jgi:hypothetical protein